ncbi:hypothetical protein MT997_28620 [Paenibacillus sp. OVF10]|nr:hypothetical protein MT997_28620 [Paenibacillus sp. OVF10]
MSIIVGVDCGLTFERDTTGISQIANKKVMASGSTYADKISRYSELVAKDEFSLLVIDGVILPGIDRMILDTKIRRTCEMLFNRELFLKYFRAGQSYTNRSGNALRRGGCDTALQFINETKDTHKILNFLKLFHPRI